MTLEEAIKYLEYLKNGLDKDTMPASIDAAELGIEALKCIKPLRISLEGLGFLPLLPGETKE